MLDIMKDFLVFNQKKKKNFLVLCNLIGSLCGQLTNQEESDHVLLYFGCFYGWIQMI